MLTQYQTQTQQLLQNPKAPTSLYAPSDITGWINTARGQLAAESESIRFVATLPITSAAQVYPFSSINLTGATGVQQVLNVRQIWVQAGTGLIWIGPRNFEWFSLYVLNNPNPSQARPTRWCQYGQGVNGTIYVNFVPDQNYTLNLDCVCLPIQLVDDSTVEAIPYPWTDAVPYYAAYLALLSSQTSARQADAQRMFSMYEEFTQRARKFSTPSVLPTMYPQQPNPTQANQLGLKKGMPGL